MELAGWGPIGGSEDMKLVGWGPIDGSDDIMELVGWGPIGGSEEMELLRWAPIGGNDNMEIRLFRCAPVAELRKRRRVDCRNFPTRISRKRQNYTRGPT